MEDHIIHIWYKCMNNTVSVVHFLVKPKISFVLFLSIVLKIYIYMYIYIEREREKNKIIY